MSAPRPAAIVIFGAAVERGGRPSRTLTRRVQAARAAGRKLADPLYVATGGVGRFHPSEAAVMRRLLLARNIPAERILIDESATDTLSSVRAVRRLLGAYEFAGDIHIATSAFHLPRCLILMWLAGYRVHACRPPRIPASRRFFKRWYWRLREVVAIPADIVLLLAMRLFGNL